jgi:transposase
LPNLGTEIVKRSDRAKGFVPLPKRWIVERTIAWLNRCRRLATAFYRSVFAPSLASWLIRADDPDARRKFADRLELSLTQRIKHEPAPLNSSGGDDAQ